MAATGTRIAAGRGRGKPLRREEGAPRKVALGQTAGAAAAAGMRRWSGRRAKAESLHTSLSSAHILPADHSSARAARYSQHAIGSNVPALRGRRRCC